MRNSLVLTIFMFLSFLNIEKMNGQGMHFSQFYQAPLLLNPANTALMPDADYRIRINYRNQWSSIPANYNTMSGYADFKVLSNYSETNWLGVGLGLFNDRAGAGDLSLFKAQLSSAYHVRLGYSSMLSFGMGFALAQRSVNFSKLSFDNQWDGFRFNANLQSGEDFTFQKTSYVDVMAGLNYAFFPNESLYLKFGIGLMHINTPKESFYNLENKIGMRPVITAEGLFGLTENWILELSGYYTEQKNAREILFGGQLSTNITPLQPFANVFVTGVYYRFNEAIIPVFGYEWNKIRVLASVDITTSDIKNANHGNGAFEISLVYKGLYDGMKNNNNNKGGYACPRF